MPMNLFSPGKIVWCVVLCACGGAFGATYYVAPAGSDMAPNDGSVGLPFREIRKALTLVHGGDTVLVADGQYKGFDVDSLNGGSTSPITIQAQGTNAQVNVTNDRQDNRDTIFVTFSSYIVIDGFRSFHANRAAMRIDQSPHITVRNCVFGDNATWGLFTDFADDLLLEKNECYGSVAEHGIYVSNTCTRPTVRGNRIHDNHANGLHMNGDESQGGAGVITNALVENNIIYGNGIGGGGSGINCDGVQNSVFRNNLIYAAHGAGITLYQIDASAPSINATVTNNTIDVADNGKWALQIHDGSSGAVVFNNIFLTHHANRGSIHFTVAADRQGLVCDYNILTSMPHAVTLDDDSSYLTFAQWQALGFDAHSATNTQANLFTDAAAGNFHLKSGCPAINVGIGVLSGKNAPAADLQGNARPAESLFDLGAFEFGSTGGGGGGGEAAAPQITSGPGATPNPAQAAQAVTFSVAAADADSATLTYAWTFGDGTSGSGASPSHAYSTAGLYTAAVTVSDGALTASGSVQVTVQEMPGGNGPVLIGSGPDDDGDGFSNTFETAGGTAPDNPASTPLGGAPATQDLISMLTVTKTSIRLNFARGGSDSISFSGTIQVPANFSAANLKATVDVGGVAKGFTLDGKGGARIGNDSFKLTVKARRGIVAAQPAKYSVAFKKGGFAAILAGSGLTNEVLRNAPRSVVYTVVINNVILQKPQALSYSARPGRAGSAR